MNVLVGLGNPGPQYELTRHNAGFLFVDYLAAECDAEFRVQPGIEFTQTILNNAELLIVKPLTYMNLSGQIVTPLIHEYGVDNVLICYDDFHLPFEHLRFRAKGSAGGHNGIKNIIEQLQSDTFQRCRIGIGEPSGYVIDYVLDSFSDDELNRLPSVFSVLQNAVSEWVGGDSFDAVMNRYNGSAT